MCNQFKKKMAKADHSSWPSQVFTSSITNYILQCCGCTVDVCQCIKA